MPPNKCQEIIKTFWRASRKFDDASYVFRELARITNADDSSCPHLQLKATRDRYIDIMGKDASDRIINFEQTCKDEQKLSHAHFVHSPHFYKTLGRNMSLWSWLSLKLKGM